MTPNVRGLFTFILISFFSLSALATNTHFEFKNTHRRVVFHFDNGKDEVIFLDDDGLEHILLSGVITAATKNTDKADEDNAMANIQVGPNNRAKIKKLFASDIAIAMVDGLFYAFDVEGKVYPLPHQKDEESFDAHWETKDFAGSNGVSMKVIARTEENPGETETKTIVTIIREPAGTYETKVFDTSLTVKFFLRNYDVKEPNDAGFQFIDSRSNAIFRDANDKVMGVILYDRMKKIADEAADSTYIKAQLLKTAEGQIAQGKANLKYVKEYLEKTVIGQPELVQALYDLELKKYMYSTKRVEPEQLTLMGLPGTGKDTAVRAYVDAMYAKKGAFRQHMFELPIVKSSATLWTLLGSSTGYVGSERTPPFLKWAVDHLGGRYIFVPDDEKKKDGAKHIEENPEWKPGMVLPGYFSPDKAVVFVNELHNWSKDEKDQFLKQVLEHGEIKLNSPGNGVATLIAPFTFILATNEGSNLIAPRKITGERATAKPLNFGELLNNWMSAHLDKDRLWSEFMRTNTKAQNGKADEAPGNSEEFVNRLVNKILLRPLSPDDLKKIAEIEMENLRETWADHYTLTWTPDFIQILQEFLYDPEMNARPIEAKVEQMVERPLLTAVSQEVLGKSPAGNQGNLALSFKRNPDRTLSLVMTGEKTTHEVPVSFSEKGKLVPIMTDEQLEKTITISDRLKKHVFGADRVADEVSKDLLVTVEGRAANQDPEKATEPSHTYMFLGPSSVGKTEMARAIAEEHLGSRNNMKVYDFSQVREIRDIKEKILGSKDYNNNPIPSDYMYEYDAHQGHVLNVLDEIANAPLDSLKALYDIFREPVVTTFSDGRPRVMSNVFNILTGNVSEKWYEGIPADLPFNMKMAAMQKIYQNAMNNPGFRRRTLEKYFSSAFIARVGEQNIFFFGPMGFKPIRELAQAKLLAALTDLKTAENRRTWDIQFASKENYIKTLEVIEDEGFVIQEQGASIDRFVKQNFSSDLRHFLLRNKVPHQAKIVLKKLADSESSEGVGAVNYQVIVNGKDLGISFNIAKRVKETMPERNDEDQILTAFHEAGHELARKVLFGDRYKSSRISVIPGVAEINDQMVVYEGIAESSQEKRFYFTLEAVMRELAVKLAGTAAQELVSRNFTHDAGKANDTERATELAQFAILKFGLSKTWGTEAVPKDMSINQYLAALSEEKRAKYEKALGEMLAEAKVMADSVILTNTTTLIPLGTELAERGEMGKKEIEEFYTVHGTKLDGQGFDRLMKSPEIFKASHDKWVDPHEENGRSLEARLSSLIPRPKKVANINDLVAAQKAKEIAAVAMPEILPVANPADPSGPTDSGPGTPSRAQETQFKIPEPNPLTNITRCSNIFHRLRVRGR